MTTTHNEVDVEKEANMKHEVGRPGDNETPHVEYTSCLEAIDEELRHSSMPHTDSTQYPHRCQNILVLSQTQEQRQQCKENSIQFITKSSAVAEKPPKARAELWCLTTILAGFSDFYPPLSNLTPSIPWSFRVYT